MSGFISHIDGNAMTTGYKDRASYLLGLIAVALKTGSHPKTENTPDEMMHGSHVNNQVLL